LRRAARSACMLLLLLAHVTVADALLCSLMSLKKSFLISTADQNAGHNKTSVQMTLFRAERVLNHSSSLDVDAS
jgi:hypothetical protein